MTQWKDYDPQEYSSPWPWVFKIGGAVVLLGALGTCVGFVNSNINQTAQVAQEQFGARALLAKYEWFKNASAQLDKKLADIQVYNRRFVTLKEAYGSTPRSGWAREDREQFNIWQAELAGIKASYNQLASEYNSEMSKFNWRFANVGQLPQGATQPLPREYKPYETD